MLYVGLLEREFKMAPTKRRSFCKEFRLSATTCYFENEKNTNQTARNFQIHWKKVMETNHGKGILTKFLDIRTEG